MRGQAIWTNDVNAMEGGRWNARFNDLFFINNTLKCTIGQTGLEHVHDSLRWLVIPWIFINRHHLGYISHLSNYLVYDHILTKNNDVIILSHTLVLCLSEIPQLVQYWSTIQDQYQLPFKSCTKLYMHTALTYTVKPHDWMQIFNNVTNVYVQIPI